MKLQEILLTDLGKAFAPQRWRPHLRRYFLKAGLYDVPYHWFGILFHFTTFVTLLLYFGLIYEVLRDFSRSSIFLIISTFFLWTVLHISIVVVCGMLLYVMIDLKVYQRTQQMESVIDQYLSLVSENLKGGVPLERALWEANRPEFGTLSTEIQYIAKRVATGEDVVETFKELTLKYNSPMVRRSFNLLIEAVEAGGSVTDLLDRIVDNIKETKLLKAEMAAANTSYTIFISIIALFVAPLLFALSFQLLVIFSSFSTRIGASLKNTRVNTPFAIASEVSVAPSDFILFSRLALIVVSVCSSMIVSMISRGDVKGGLKYIPLFVIASVVSFSVMVSAFSSIFQGLIQ